MKAATHLTITEKVLPCNPEADWKSTMAIINVFIINKGNVNKD